MPFWWTDEIQRDYELNASFSFSGTSLERWHLISLVIIVENTLPPEDTMQKSFIRKWACSATWGPRQWNIGYDLFGVAFTHPFKSYAPVNVSTRIFHPKYLSWLVPRLWPEIACLSKKFTPRRDAILVNGWNTERLWAKRVLFILRYVFGEVTSDVSSYHSGKYIAPWECRSWDTKLAIWDSRWLRHSPSSHAQKQSGEWSESKSK